MSRFSTFGRVTAVAVVLTTALASTPAFAASSYPVKLKVTATGTKEMGGKGSPTGSGSATFTINESKGTICYSIKFKALAGINGVHIHKGAAGVDGPVVVALNAKRFNKTGSACVKESPAVLGEIAMDPGMYYFNIHTKKFPAGAVRGQLTGIARTKKVPAMKTHAPKPPATKAPATNTPTTKAPSPKAGY